MTGKIQLFEELSLNAHPALQTQLYDGWVLRFANGYTKRANSINPLYPSRLNLHTKMNESEKRYFEYGLPAVYKLTDIADPNIDKTLAQIGYKTIEPTYVMIMDLEGKAFPFSECVTTSYADDEWLNAYFTFSNYSDNIKMSSAKQILNSVRNTMICGRIIRNGKNVACGSAVIERGYMSLLNVVVDKPQRGKGYGQDICQSLLSAARRLGSHTAYLQVVQENYKAVNLYRKLGFKSIYSYWYRIKEYDAK